MRYSIKKSTRSLSIMRLLNPFFDYCDSQTDTNMFVQTFDEYLDFPPATHPIERRNPKASRKTVTNKVAWSAVDEQYKKVPKMQPINLENLTGKLDNAIRAYGRVQDGCYRLPAAA